MNIAVIGTGYVGLVTGVCLASMGHSVIGIDIDAAKVASLEAGIPDIFEHGLEDLLHAELESQRIRFTTDVQHVAHVDVVLIAVGTPQRGDGKADLSAVFAVVEATATFLKFDSTIVTKSTVPVGTGEAIAKMLSDVGRTDVGVASNPEFLRQGYAVHDFLHPDRIVIGADDTADLDRLAEMYSPIVAEGTPLIRTNTTTAELVKYAANTFLATKLAYVNEMADLCEIVGASIDDITYAVGLDDRIAPSYMVAGPGFGGSCLPKDTVALLHTFSASGTHSRILAAAIEANQHRRAALAERIISAVGHQPERVAVWGLTFKADTDDLRDSPAIDLIRGLVRRNIDIVAYDPLVRDLPDDLDIRLASSAIAAAGGADAVVVATEWPQFGEVDLDELAAAMAGTTVVDLRNTFRSEALNSVGLDHHPLGGRRSLTQTATDSPR